MFWLQCQFTASSSAPIRPLTFVVQLLSRVWLCVTPMDCSTPGFILPHCFPEFAQIYVRWVMPSNCLTLCCPLFFFSSIFPSIGVFSSESVLHIRWPRYWSFSFSISPSNEYPALIFRMDWLDLLTVHGNLKSLLQHHSSKASVLWCSAFFIVQLSHLLTESFAFGCR